MYAGTIIPQRNNNFKLWINNKKKTNLNMCRKRYSVSKRGNDLEPCYICVCHGEKELNHQKIIVITEKTADYKLTR